MVPPQLFHIITKQPPNKTPNNGSQVQVRSPYKNNNIEPLTKTPAQEAKVIGPGVLN